MTSRAKPETGIQATIVKALRTAGYVVLRIHCGKVKVRGGWMQQNEEGTPDLYVVGKCFLETKTPIGTMSKEQRDMVLKLWAQGVPVYTARSAGEALEAVVNG